MPEMTLNSLLLLLVCGGSAWGFYARLQLLPTLGKVLRPSRVSAEILELKRQAVIDAEKFHFDDHKALDTARAREVIHVTLELAAPADVPAELARQYWDAFASHLNLRLRAMCVQAHVTVWEHDDKSAKLSVWL